MAEDRYGQALLAAQVAAIAAGLWPAPRRWLVPRPVAAGAVALTVGGAALGFAGLADLGRRFRPVPMPAADAELRTGGAYAVVRHPMYTSLLASGAGVAVLRARPEPWAALAALALVLRAKVAHEEGLLRDRFGADYDAYARRVPRLTPWPRPSDSA
jgi:protein-S-isoprenylcysteine O-methyltransferase Ste14